MVLIASAYAKEQKPLDAEAYFYRGLEYGKKGQYDNAIADFTKVLLTNPRHTGALNNRGIAHRDKGEYDKAIGDFDRAILINPKFADAYFNRGTAYYFKGQHDKAISDYSRAIEINPEVAEFYAKRGYVYMAKLGDKERGCSDWKRACQLGECANYEISVSKGDCE